MTFLKWQWQLIIQETQVFTFSRKQIVYSITLVSPMFLQICVSRGQQQWWKGKGVVHEWRLFPIAAGITVLSSVYLMPWSQQLKIPCLLFRLLIIICLEMFAERDRSRVSFEWRQFSTADINFREAFLPACLWAALPEKSACHHHCVKHHVWLHFPRWRHTLNPPLYKLDFPSTKHNCLIHSTDS